MPCAQPGTCRTSPTVDGGGVWVGGSDDLKDLATDNRQVRQQVLCLQRIFCKIRSLKDLASCQRAKTTEAAPLWDGFLLMLSPYVTRNENAVTASTVVCDQFFTACLRHAKSIANANPALRRRAIVISSLRDGGHSIQSSLTGLNPTWRSSLRDAYGRVAALWFRSRTWSTTDRTESMTTSGASSAIP